MYFVFLRVLICSTNNYTINFIQTNFAMNVPYEEWSLF